MSAHALSSLDSGMSSLADSYATSKTSSTPGSPSDEGIHEKPFVSLPFFCLECSIGFEDDISLERHAEDTHDPQKLSLSIDESTNELDSDSCDISVSSKINEPIHATIIPTAVIIQKPIQPPPQQQQPKLIFPHLYSCENCDLTFTDAMHLNEHHRSEHEEYDDVYNCSLCEKKFVDRKGLLFHTRNIHKPPVMKDPQELLDNSNGNLNDSKASIDGNCQDNNMSGQSYNGSGIRPKGNIFRANSYPRRPNPVGVVVGEKPRGDANWHKTIENGEEKIEMSVEKQEGDRPYGCEICGSRFKLKAVLMRHIRCVHSESRPYLCSYCGSSFKIRNRLTTHIKMVHPQYLHEYVREWRNGNAIKPIPIVINSPN